MFLIVGFSFLFFRILIISNRLCFFSISKSIFVSELLSDMSFIAFIRLPAFWTPIRACSLEFGFPLSLTRRGVGGGEIKGVLSQKFLQPSWIILPNNKRIFKLGKFFD